MLLYSDKDYIKKMSLLDNISQGLILGFESNFLKEIGYELSMADEGEDISVLGSETKFIARINPNSSVEEGQKINLALDPTKLHYFDPDTGLAIT